MSSKKNKGKKQAVSLADFQGDEWSEKQTKETDVTRRFADAPEAPVVAPVRDFKKVGDMANFRDNALDQDPPYLAHIKNLKTGLPESELINGLDPVKPKKGGIQLVTKEFATFAFVEFETLTDLERAICLKGKMVQNRKMEISLATPDQKARWVKNNSGGGEGGRGMGGRSASGFALDRDSMGQAQAQGGHASSFRSSPNTRNSSEDIPAFGSNQQPRSPVEFSRDLLGSAKQPDPSAAGSFGSGHKRGARSPNTPNSNPFAAVEDWREMPREEQPAYTSTRRGLGSRNESRTELERSTTEDSAKSPTGDMRSALFSSAAQPPRESSSFRGRGSKPASPNTNRPPRNNNNNNNNNNSGGGGAAALENWRNEPPKTQPPPPPVASEGKDNKDNKRKSPEASGSWAARFSKESPDSADK